MYVDKGRQADLERLDRVLNDSQAPQDIKLRAFKSKKKILAQLPDKKLTAMRTRLIGAVNGDDKREIWKITCQIKEYLKEDIPIDVGGA